MANGAGHAGGALQRATIDIDWSVLDLVAAPVVRLDREGRIEGWNRACTALTGFTLAEVRGRRLWDVGPGGAETEAPRALAAALAQGRLPEVFECPWTLRDGRPKWLAWSAAPPAPGAPLVVTGSDVSELRAAEDERRRLVLERAGRQQLLEAVLRQMPVGVIIRDADGRLVAANRQAVATVGVVPVVASEEALAAQRVWHADGRPYTPAELPILRALRGEEVRGEELIYERPGGRRAIVESSAEPVVEDDAIIGGVMVLADVSDRKRAEEALRGRELQLRALFDHSFQFVALLTPDGILLDANRPSLDFAGYTRGEVLGRPFVETRWWTSADSKRKLEHALAEAREGRFVRSEVDHTSVQGRTLVFDFSISPVRDDAGAVVLLVAEARDITARKELERLREEYVGFISHDLRSPLNTIALRAEALERSLEQAGRGPDLESARLILLGARRIGAMVTELLESAHLESGRVELKLESVDLAQLLTHALDSAIAPAARARVRVELPNAPAVARADAHRLERVAVNLLTNALKYATPGTPITVRLALEDGRALASVADEGPGIDASEAAHLFEKFRRARTSQGAEGLGLGLYISRLIVEAHGGRIWVDSAPGRGSTFTFALPLADGSRPEPAPRPTARAGARVLVVEDEPVALRAVAELLRDEGYEVETATDATHALDRIGVHSPDVLLFDLDLPGMGGAELMRRVREQDPRIAGVLMTGHGRDHADVEGLCTGCDVEHLAKPLRFDELLAVVARAAARRT